jgi:hypothetical protein
MAQVDQDFLDRVNARWSDPAENAKLSAERQENIAKAIRRLNWKVRIYVAIIAALLAVPFALHYAKADEASNSATALQAQMNAQQSMYDFMNSALTAFGRFQYALMQSLR